MCDAPAQRLAASLFVGNLLGEILAPSSGDGADEYRAIVDLLFDFAS